MYKKQVFKVGRFANRKIDLYLHSLCGCGGTGRPVCRQAGTLGSLAYNVPSSVGSSFIIIFYAGVVELVDTLDLGFIQIKSVNLHFMRVWWNW